MGRALHEIFSDQGGARQYEGLQSRVARDAQGRLEVFGQIERKISNGSASLQDACLGSKSSDQRSRTLVNKIAKSRLESKLLQALVYDTAECHDVGNSLRKVQRATLPERSHENEVDTTSVIPNLRSGEDCTGGFWLDDSTCDPVVASMVPSQSSSNDPATIRELEDVTRVAHGSESSERHSKLPRRERVVDVITDAASSPMAHFAEDERGSEISDESELKMDDKSSKWETVLNGMKTGSRAASLDDFNDSSTWGRASSDSMSDEAISGRAAEWGIGVATMVLRNSSRESTPRTSDGSSRGSHRHPSPDIPKVSKRVRDALSTFQLAFVVCDATHPDIPILYASAGFFHMTGFSPEEVVGKNCRFLQGDDTDAIQVARIKEALKNGEVYTGTLLNYKKDNTPFWNLLTLNPIKDSNGIVIKYIGMQAEVKFSGGANRRKTVPRSGHLKNSTRPPVYQYSSRSHRDESMPVFSIPSKSEVGNNLSLASTSKRYSLTIDRGALIESRRSGFHTSRPSDARSVISEKGAGRPLESCSSRRQTDSTRRPAEKRRSKANFERESHGNSTAAPELCEFFDCLIGSALIGKLYAWKNRQVHPKYY